MRYFLILVGLFLIIAVGLFFLRSRANDVPIGQPKPLIEPADEVAAAKAKYSKPAKKLMQSELGSDMQAKAAIIQASQILTKTKQLCETFKLKFVGSSEFSPTEGTISELGSFLTSPDSLFHFYAPTGQLLAWRNDALRKHLNSGDGDLVSKSSLGQQWSKDKALQIGTAFLQALLAGVNVRVNSGDAYVWTTGAGEYKEGTRIWVCRWKRLDSQGYRFYGDEFKIEIPEGYSPVEINLSEVNSYSEEKGTLISQNKAFAIARQVHTLTSKDSYPVVILDDTLHLENEATSPEVVGHHLMWIFWVSAPEYTVQPILIDAYTGEYELGGLY